MVSRMGGESVTQSVGSSSGKVSQEVGKSVVQVQAISENVQQDPNAENLLPADKAKQMTDTMNSFLESANTQLRFKFHEKLNEYYVTIVDSKTDEIVREIPSKKLMDIHAAMREFVGMLIDRKI